MLEDIGSVGRMKLPINIIDTHLPKLNGSRLDVAELIYRPE